MKLDHRDYLDGWRGLAICCLLIGHFFPVPGINFGAVGVNLFFVLSGLFMSRLLFIQEVPLAVFFRRRISRIFPATFCFLGIVLIAFIAAGRPVSWKETLAAALFANNYFSLNAREAVMPFGHVWSLAVEEHSYILLAFLALLCRRGMLSAKASTLFASLATACASIYYFDLSHMGSARWLRTEVAGYGVFVSAFLAVAINERKVREVPWFVCPTLVLGGIALHWWSIPIPARSILGIGAFALAVNLLDAAPQVIHKILSFKPLRWLGIMSFSLYLWQQPFYLAMHWNGMNRMLAVSLAFVCATASFYLIERPMREYLNRRWGGAAMKRQNSPALHVESI